MTTELQSKMLVKIAEDECTPVNGARPTCREDAGTFANCVIDDAEDRGVVRSLVNAGLVNHYGTGREAVVGLTDAGFAEYNRIKDTAK